MAMTSLAGSVCRINEILNGSVYLLNGMLMVLQYPIKILRQELMAEINGLYGFHWILMAN